jgi:hypothetical protein
MGTGFQTSAETRSKVFRNSLFQASHPNKLGDRGLIVYSLSLCKNCLHEQNAILLQVAFFQCGQNHGKAMKKIKQILSCLL